MLVSDRFIASLLSVAIIPIKILLITGTRVMYVISLDLQAGSETVRNEIIWYVYTGAF
jgi:hypothetical protein